MVIRVMEVLLLSPCWDISRFSEFTLGLWPMYYLLSKYLF